MTDTKELTTDRVLASMLTENTGRHMLDSGGAYGRHWEENQGKTVEDFQEEPPIVVRYRVSTREAIPTINVFHYCRRHLEFAPEVDEQFQVFDGKHDGSHLSAMEAFPEQLEGEAFGLYGEGQPMTVNTYNAESALSQTLQFVLYSHERHGDVILLQIHGGCDVRGGYTIPRAFHTKTEPASFLMAADAYLVDPDGPGHRKSWRTDNAGYNWYEDGSTKGDLTEDYSWVRWEPDMFGGIENPRDLAAGHNMVVVLDDHTALSPVSGAELELGF